MYIVHIAAELAPLAKVGGLADVVLGLSRELSWKGHDIDIIIPKYDCLDSEQIRDLTIEMKDLMSFYQGEWYPTTVWKGWVENLKVYFIDPHHPRFFFKRGCFYGCEDDIERFLYFSRAAMEFLYKRPLHPDIIHLHDWQTAVIPAIYQDLYHRLGYQKAKTVLTIHNLDYQGQCAPHDLTAIGLDGPAYLAPSKMEDPLSPHLINLLKGGIVYSHFVTTVSPTYAKEILNKEGKGLESVLKEYQNKFKGILNGIDYSYWNPEIDRFLPAHYSPRELPSNKKDRHTLDTKGFLKKVLREKLNLAEDYRPIIGCIARLVPQKGIELIKHTIQYVADKKKAQFVLLGSSPIESLNREFHQLQHHYSNHPHISLTLHHQESLAHLIYAGSDLLIVPSLFEPCGLTQIIALKYGTVPVVRRTGGLADTVFDVDHSGKSFDQTNGYVFDHPGIKEMEAVLERAISCWFDHPEKWRHLMLNGMKMDFSWNLPSNIYLEIYKKLHT